MTDNKRTYEGVYNGLKKISEEEGIDFGLNNMSSDDFKAKYFTGPGNIEVLHHKLSQISDETGLDFGQGTREEWLSSFGYKKGDDGYTTLDGKKVGRKPSMQAASTKPQQPVKNDTVEIDGNVVTESQLEALEAGAPVKQKPQPVMEQPAPLQPEEPEKPSFHTFADKVEETKRLAKSQGLNNQWAAAQQEVVDKVVGPGQHNFGDTMESVKQAEEVEAARRMNRAGYDQQHFDSLFSEHVMPTFAQERAAGEQRSAEANKNVPQYDIPGAQSGFARLFERSVNYEKETDPAKIVSNTLSRVEKDNAFGDYVMGRMGIDKTKASEDGASVPQLSDSEKEWMKYLFGVETGEVADQISQRIYDQYKQEGAPESVLQYIAGKAFHENLAASLFNSMVTRAANSSGMREQLRAMAYEQYGQDQNWAVRMAGGAAPFAVDMVAGGFALPNAVGGAVVKGGVSMAAKQVTKQMAKRSAAQGLKNAALEEAVKGGAGVAERYLATQAPIVNLAIRSAGGAANFATYDMQNEVVRQIAAGEFKPFDLIKEAVHGAVLGGVMGVAGGTIGHLTRNAGRMGKIAGGAAGLGAETTIFGISNGLQKAMDDGEDISSVDWADTMGEAFGQVVGMKAVGAVMHPREFLNRYRKSKDYDLQLNQRDLTELKEAGYNFDDIFKGLGKFGEVAPMEGNIIRKATEITPGPEGTGTKRSTTSEEAWVDAEAYKDIMQNPDISSSTKRKIAYVATGTILTPEPVFGVQMTVGEDGHIELTTTNAYGSPIETKDYTDEAKAKADLDELEGVSRINTIDGLERIAAKAGFDGLVDEAKGRTMTETGGNVDEVLTSEHVNKESANAVLDNYIKNLQEAYMQRFNEKLQRLGGREAEPINNDTEVKAGDEAGITMATGGNESPAPATQQAGAAVEQPERSERRQAAYERGAAAIENTSDIANISYEADLASARMAQLFPDSDPVLSHLRNDIIKAVEEGNDAEVGRLINANAGYMDARQKEAIEQYLDVMDTTKGVDDALSKQIDDYQQRRSEELKNISTPDGNITRLSLADGTMAYYKAGDLNNPNGSVMITTADGENKQISTSQISAVHQTINADALLNDEVQLYREATDQQYACLADGSNFVPGAQVELAIAGSKFMATMTGQDANGNFIFQMEDGSQMPMTPADAQKAVNDANMMKINEALKQEKAADIVRQQTERFNKGISGFAEGKMDLTAKGTDPKAAAEYLMKNSEDGKHDTALKLIQQNIDLLNGTQTGALEIVRMLSNKEQLGGLTPEEEARLAEARAAIDDAEARHRKWGEIRQALMNEEERQELESERQKDIQKAMDNTKKNFQIKSISIGDPIPTTEQLLENFEDKSDASDHIDKMMTDVKSYYRDKLYPALFNVRDQIDDYRKGLIDMHPGMLEDLTRQLTELEDEETYFISKQNELKKVASAIGRVYAQREKENMTPHERAIAQLEKETNKDKKLKLAKEAYAEDAEALAVLEDTEPRDVYEHIAANLGASSINWEGIQRGEHYVRGLRDELGKDKTRGIGKDADTFGFNYFLAPEGKGKGVDEVVHNISESSPYDTEEVRNALLDMLASAGKPTDISHRIIDDRIARAEEIYEENRRRDAEAEEDAKREAEDAAIMEMTGLTPEEYDAFIGDLEARLAEQEGYKTSEEYFNQLSEENDRANEGNAGGSQEARPLAEQREETKPSGVETADKEGAAEPDAISEGLPEALTEIKSKPIQLINTKDEIVKLGEKGLGEEFVNSLMEDYNDPQVFARYMPETGLIYLFADKIKKSGVNSDVVKGFVYHENIHGLSDGRLSAADFARIAELIGEVDKDFHDTIQQKHKDYVKEVQDEEIVAYFIQDIIHHGDVSFLLDGSLDFGNNELNDYINDIVSKLKSKNNEQATAPRLQQTDAEGGTGGTAEEQPHGTSVLEEEGAVQEGAVDSPIQGLDGYTEKDVTDLVRNHFNELVGEDGVEIVDMKVIGSRVWGDSDDNSDLDVLLEYKGNMSEDGLFNILNDEENRLTIEGIPVDINPITKGKSGTIAQFLERNKDYDKAKDKLNMSFPERLEAAKAEVDVNPTEEQKKAGNYKMGHVRFGGYRMSIENPKGSTRSGVDTNGKPWSIKMQDTYGYIGGKYGTDGDHLDFFINDDADLDNWNGRVFIVDQKNEDGTFDEHKVMYGYPTWNEAKKAYERNYEAGWWDKHVMQMMGVMKEDFDAWLKDSDHKRKPFAEYFRTKENKDVVSDNVDQLLADVKERVEASKPAEVAPSVTESELQKSTKEELQALKKDKEKQISLNRYFLKAADVKPGSEKEAQLKGNMSQAEADIKAIDAEIERKEAEAKKRIEQQEIGFAMTDRLEDMGIDVTTDLNEMRAARKQAQSDNSENGKLRHFETPDGKIYGFVYKGKMFLDPRKLDAELPIHEYAHPWCEAVRRLNPDNWKDIVGLMKSDKDTWEFIKSMNPDLTDDGDIAEEMIAKFSGKRGAERAQAEFERMNVKDPDYKSKWANIWANISKAIQDFWKKVGDFLNIKYESAEQVYDQVVRDFANKVNPRKRVEDWLKQRDDEYLKAVEAGDDTKAKELFDAALRENIGNGIVPFVAVDAYKPLRKLAHGVKDRDPKVIAEVADKMAPLIPKDAVLVPAPSHTGKATDMLDLAKAISERTGAPVADVLKSAERGSQYEAKYAGQPIASKDMGITMQGELPADKVPVVIDNVVDTGNTAEACVKALGKGVVASLADSADRYKHVASLKSAEPIVVGKDGKVVPLSKRFEMAGKYLDKAPQAEIDFMVGDGASEASIVSLPRIDDNGYNLNDPIGRKVARLKKEGGKSSIVGFIDSETGDYIVLGKDADTFDQLVSNKGIVSGTLNGMRMSRFPAQDFDIVSPRVVRAGYKMGFTTDQIDDVDKMLDEADRRNEFADKKEAEKRVKEYLSKKPKNEEEAVRQRATKAVLNTLEKAGVPFKVVSKKEEKQMMRIFSMMNQDAVKDFARKWRSLASTELEKHARYIVYNMNDPFAVPAFFQKQSTGKFGLQAMKQMAPQGDWVILDIGYPGEAVDNNELRNAADMNVGDLQADIEVWHGSGAVFTRFDHSHMGEGANSQSFGWGTYLSSSRKVAEGYTNLPGDIRYSHLGEEISKKDTVMVMAAEIMTDPAVKNSRDAEKFANRFKNRVVPGNEERLKLWDEVIEVLRNSQKSDFETNERTPILYKVDIPDDNGDNYLDFQRPVGKELAEKIRDFVYDHVMTSEDKGVYNGMDDEVIREDIDRVLETESNMAWMQRALETRGVTPKEFSQWLSKQGYVGIKYPAGTIMGRGDGATNYVIFNEDDAKIVNTIEFMVSDGLKEGKRVLGWSDGKQVYLTEAGLNPNTPIHECTHLWDKWCMKEHPDLWKKLVNAMKKTSMWEDISKNPNYRNIWNDDDRMASEVHSRLSGTTGEDEFMKAAFKKDTPQSIINEVKSVLKKFWEAVLRLFNKHTKTIGDDFNSLESIIRMPLRDLLNQDFEKVMDAAKRESDAHVEGHIENNVSDNDKDEIVRSRGNLSLLVERREKLRNSKPAVIEGDEIAIASTPAEQRKIVKEYAKTVKLAGAYTNKDTGNVINLQRGRVNGGIMELLQHDFKDAEHIQSIAAIPQIIENSIYITSEENKDKTKNPNISEYQYYVCGLKIGGDDYTVRSSIAVDKDGNRYYDHKLTQIEKGKLLDLTERVTNPAQDEAARLFGGKDNKLFSILQINSPENIKEVVEGTAEQLGGIQVVTVTKDDADAFLRGEIESGTKGFYDPNTGEVKLLLDNIEDIEDAKRTVCHEKLGHEGLVALLGSQDAVNKFGNFIFDNASSGLRMRMLEKADEEGYDFGDTLRYSKAAQEVFADIAADGPKTADEFDLWTKVKHYIIKVLKKLGVRIRGLVNDHDLRYYVLKTGEALKRWNKMSGFEKARFAKQATNGDIMRSRGGKPRKRNDESDAQYIQRLREWEKWNVAKERAEAAGDPMPDKETIDQKYEDLFKADMDEWSQQHGISIEEINAGPGAFPRRERNETPQEYAVRVADFETKRDLWDSAPNYFDYMERAQAEYKQAYTDWKRRYDLQEQENVDLNVYEGVGGDGPETDAESEAEARMEHDLADAVGVEIDSEGAKRHAKLAVIERRKNLESSNAEDAIWLYNFVKKSEEVAKTMSERTGQKVTGKMLREAMPFIIEGTYWEEILRDEDGNIVGINDISDQMPIKKGPELDDLLADVKEWYNQMYFMLEDAGLRGDAGFIENYVNHVWDKKKSDPKAWEKYVENYQRTKSPNMRHREIDTYQEGIDVGLVPKFKDIADMIAYYSRQNNEAVANKNFLSDLTGYQVTETNSDGEVVSILPLLKYEKPDALTRDRYAQYYVPGVGDVYVIKDAQKRFASVFGTMRTQDVADWLSDFAKGYDLTASTMKKIQLSISGFHMGALTEVAFAQMRPDRAMRALFKYIFYDSVKAGTIPAYAHQEDFKFAASHLVQLGATEDYAAADVNNITGRLKEMMHDLYESDGAVKKAAGAAGSVPAIMLDWVNKGMDKVLWNYLHDGLKIACFKMFAEQIDARVEKEGLTPDMREKLLDEAGQYVNDTFGGQYFELLNISPGMVKWLRRALLSPDWLISTQRHFMANFGFGSLYSDSSFKNYLKYNADNIKRLFGTDIANDELRRFRSKNAKQCYILGVCFFFYTMMNAINAFFRRQDEEEQQQLAEEERKSNPDYRSPYELAYPDGMKWYDYTMWGNGLGQQTHLYVGRYEDGSETYVRWGKQFREFPEMFIGRHGVEFPTPLIDRMMGKANPMVSLVRDNLGSLGVWGFTNSKDIEEIQAKYGKTIGVLAMNARHFLPFSVPTQAEKEFKAIDLIMPSQKGFTRYKTVDFFKTYIQAGDMEGVIKTYNAAVMNNIDAEACLKAAITTIKATQRKEMADGVVDLNSAVERFDNSTSLPERKLMRRKIRQYLSGNEYNAFSRNDAIEQVNIFLDGEDMEKITIKEQNYLMNLTSEDVIADWRIASLKVKAKEYYKKIEKAKNDGNDSKADALELRYNSWLEIKNIIREYESELRKYKDDLGEDKGKDAKTMKEIRKLRKEVFDEIDKLQAPK